MNWITELFRELITSALKGGVAIALFGAVLLFLTHYAFLDEFRGVKIEDTAWLAVALGSALIGLGLLSHLTGVTRSSISSAGEWLQARQQREQIRSRIIGNLGLLDLHEKLLLLYVLQKPDGRIRQIDDYGPFERLMTLGIIHDDTVEEGEENPDGYYPRGGVVRCAACVFENRERIMQDIKPAVANRFSVDPDDAPEVARQVAIISARGGHV